MSHKTKILIISVLATAMLLVTGLVGSQVFAQSGANTATSANTTVEDPQKVLADKVAAILGLDAATVENALTQAQKEIQSEALDSHLKQLVEAGTITQAQADAYKAWLESKSDVNIPGLDGGMSFGHGGGMKGPGGGGFNPQGNPPPADSSSDSSSSGTN